MPGDTSGDVPLSWSDVRWIVRRAVQLDGEATEGASETVVREIARELGVSDRAVERAIAEHRQRSRPVLPRSIRRWTVSSPEIRSIVVATTGAFMVGAAARGIRPFVTGPIHWESLISAIGVAAVLGLLSLRPAPRHPQRVFQAISLGVWCGYTAGWALIHGSLWGDLVGVTFSLAVGSAVIGGLITNHRSQTEAREVGPPPPQREGLFQRMKNQLRRGVEHLLERRSASSWTTEAPGLSMKVPRRWKYGAIAQLPPALSPPVALNQPFGLLLRVHARRQK